jgi:hypothetical protein
MIAVQAPPGRTGGALAFSTDQVTLRSMIFHSLYQWASFLALVVSAGAGLWLGRWPERLGASAMLAAWLATALSLNGTQLWGPQWGVMIIDVLLLAVLLFIALRSDRWWPLWACGFHALSVVLHLAVMADPKIWGRAYFVAGNAFSYLVMGALFIGAVGRWRPRRTDAAS